MTSTRPTAPASRPAFSCVPASVGPSNELPLSSNVSGSAPYLSWFASARADVAVKLPEICDDPSVKWPFVVGALSTSPSSTMAKRLVWSLPCCCCA